LDSAALGIHIPPPHTSHAPAQENIYVNTRELKCITLNPTPIRLLFHIVYFIQFLAFYSSKLNNEIGSSKIEVYNFNHKN
jgi:hypothetical protein